MKTGDRQRNGSGRNTAQRIFDVLYLATSWSSDAEVITWDKALYQSAELLGISSHIIEP